eukprot:scaffold91848_cov39-Prasinocladus_malaysianus.AAC.1
MSCRPLCRQHAASSVPLALGSMSCHRLLWHSQRLYSGRLKGKLFKPGRQTFDRQANTAEECAIWGLWTY